MAEELGRNDWCPCGSGKKVKNCCRDSARRKKNGQVWSNGWYMTSFALVTVVLMGWVWYANHQPDPRDTMPEIGQVGSPTVSSSVTAYTEIPEVDLTVLTSDQRKTVLDRVNVEKCPCGCGFTIAGCRHLDASCGTSLPLVKQIVAEVTAGP